MFKLTITQAVFFYILAFILGILLYWLIFENKKFRKNFIASEDNIWYCNICGYAFIDTVHQEVSKCPRCLSYVEVDNISKDNIFLDRKKSKEVKNDYSNRNSSR